jgi:HK97 family phage prohead protease
MTLSETKLETAFGERAVQLCDGRSGLRGGLTVTAKAEDNAPVIEFTASDETLDRYDEVIEAKGWDLKNYQRNPVFQNSHKYGDIVFTLGKSLVTEVRGTALVQRIEFAVDINPVAKLAYDLYRGGFLNAVSVGFIPLEWQDGGGANKFARKFLKQELLELSAVSIPANPNALQNAVKAGAVDRSDLRDLAEFLKSFCSTKAEAESNASASGSAVNDARLLRLKQHAEQTLRRM